MDLGRVTQALFQTINLILESYQKKAIIFPKKSYLPFRYSLSSNFFFDFCHRFNELFIKRCSVLFFIKFSLPYGWDTRRHDIRTRFRVGSILFLPSRFFFIISRNVLIRVIVLTIAMCPVERV